MNIKVNGKDIDFNEEYIIALLELYKINPDTVVVEQNGEIVHRETYTESKVGEGDTIEIVKFVGGG